MALREMRGAVVSVCLYPVEPAFETNDFFFFFIALVIVKVSYQMHRYTLAQRHVLQVRWCTVHVSALRSGDGSRRCSGHVWKERR